MNHECLNLTKGRPMKRWALVVAVLYCLILAASTVPVIALTFAPQVTVPDTAKADWLWLTACVGFHIGALVMTAVGDACGTI